MGCLSSASSLHTPFCLLGVWFPALFGQAEPWEPPAHHTGHQLTLSQPSLLFKTNSNPLETGHCPALIPLLTAPTHGRSAPSMARRGKAARLRHRAMRWEVKYSFSSVFFAWERASTWLCRSHTAPAPGRAATQTVLTYTKQYIGIYQALPQAQLPLLPLQKAPSIRSAVQPGFSFQTWL